MAKPKKRFCSICGAELPKGELGFNPEPYKPFSSGTCCIKCFRDKVLPLRSNQPVPHKETAKKIFNTKEVNEVQRRLAKTINFGIMYGAGDITNE